MQGFPTIVVTTDARGVKRITQRPYQNFTELHLPESPYNYKWIIPDWYRYAILLAYKKSDIKSYFS